jgi:hypothetical protein
MAIIAKWLCHRRCMGYQYLAVKLAANNEAFSAFAVSVVNQMDHFVKLKTCDIAHISGYFPNLTGSTPFVCVAD